jgi:hypothetical protein
VLHDEDEANLQSFRLWLVLFRGGRGECYPTVLKDIYIAKKRCKFI